MHRWKRIEGATHANAHADARMKDDQRQQSHKVLDSPPLA
jgi:hypothetical protein